MFPSPIQDQVSNPGLRFRQWRTKTSRNEAAEHHLSAASRDGIALAMFRVDRAFTLMPHLLARGHRSHLLLSRGRCIRCRRRGPGTERLHGLSGSPPSPRYVDTGCNPLRNRRHRRNPAGHPATECSGPGRRPPRPNQMPRSRHRWPRRRSGRGGPLSTPSSSSSSYITSFHARNRSGFPPQVVDLGRKRHSRRCPIGGIPPCFQHMRLPCRRYGCERISRCRSFC